MNIIQQKIQSFLMRELTILVSNTVDQARDNASWSTTIPNAIKLGSAQNNDGVISIDIIVDLKEAPQAAAFEYGSGLHRKENPALYPIEAKNADNLVFWWEKRNKLFVGPKLPYGHPGVKARPYLKPAIDRSRKSIRGRLLNLFKMGYIESVPRVTIIEVK